MADTRGTWSLSEAWAEKASAEWVPVPSVWLNTPSPDVRERWTEGEFNPIINGKRHEHGDKFIFYGVLANKRWVVRV